VQQSYDGAIVEAPLFHGLAALTFDQVRDGLSVAALDSGASLFRQGEPATRLYMVAEGRLDLSRAVEDGRDLVVSSVIRGSVCGGVAVLGRVRTYPVSAVAAQPSVVLAWSGELLRGLARGDARLGLNLAELMYDHAQEIESRFDKATADHVDRRVAAALVRLARRAGRRVAGGVLIDLPLTPRELADISVTTLHTASSLLGRWERAGLIKAAQGIVVLCDPRALSAIAGVADH
jgi:CRP/FNR family transcriptional regulator, nitrogen oxide reductase regulator